MRFPRLARSSNLALDFAFRGALRGAFLGVTLSGIAAGPIHATAAARTDDPPAPTTPAPTPPVTPPVTPPDPPAPAADPTPTAPTSGAKKPRRVHIIEDRFHEWSGTVEAEEPDYLVVTVRGKPKIFYRARVLEIIDLVDPAPNQPGVVHMRDGRTYSGLIIEDAFDHVEIEIEGIRQKLVRADVHYVALTLTPRQFYERAKGIIKAADFSERLKLAQYLYRHEMYREAHEELVALLEVVELHEAKELLRTVDAQLALIPKGAPTSTSGADGAPTTANGLPKARAKGDEEGDGPEPPTPPAPAKGHPSLEEMLPTKLLTPEDVNLIRVYEFDFNRPPRVVVTPDLVRTMIEKYADSNLIPATAEQRNSLFRQDPVKLVRLLFDLRARELYPAIEVQTEPFALNLFRLKVHNTWLIGNCATSQCHGGVDSGRFFLFNRHTKKPTVRYTNLMILERLHIPEQPPLIDWEKPLDSLIVQFGLPRTEARHPHPDVKGWKPVFGPSNKKLLEDFVTWTRAMYQPRPDYPVVYEPPQLKAPDAASSGGERVPR